MLSVRLKQATFIGHTTLPAGEVLDLEPGRARRFVEAGVAEIVAVAPAAEVATDPKPNAQRATRPPRPKAPAES